MRHNMYRLLGCLLLPALALVATALAQLLLTAVWPGIREIRTPIVSADGYFAVLCPGILCFGAGYLLRRWVGGLSGFVCAAIVPAAYLGLILWALVGAPMWQFGAHIAWRRPLTLFGMAWAILPLLGLALGWWVSFTPTPGHRVHSTRAAG